MTTRRLLATTAALLFGAAATTHADVIDDFENAQGTTGVTAAPGGASLFQAGSGILGGERDLRLDVTLGSANFGTRPFPGTPGTGEGVLSLINDPVSLSNVSVVWDGVDGADAINMTGLGGVTFGSDTTGLEFEVIFNDIGGNFTFTIDVWDGSGTLATQWLGGTSGTGIAPPIAIFPLPFSQGTGGPFGGWTNDPYTTFTQTGLGAIRLDIQTVNLAADFDIGEFRQTVPTPATIALFGLGLAGIGAARRKRRS
jgi:hypothetical protein